VQKRFRWLESRLVLPFQLVLRKTAERSSRKKEWQCVADQINAAMVFARGESRKRELSVCSLRFRGYLNQSPLCKRTPEAAIL